MPAPSQLSIATGAVTRLLKEESSYHKELEQQQARIEKLKSGGGEGENAEFQLKQELKAAEETKAVFPPLRQRIMAAASQLEEQLNGSKESPEEEVSKAKEALKQAKSMKD